MPISPESVNELSLKQIQDILSSGEFERFKNTKENEFLEAKPLGWIDFSNGHRDHCKLGKSAASFANQKGGFVIVGLELYDRNKHDIPEDIVECANSFSVDEFNTNRIQSAIRETTFPKINAEVRWYPSNTDNSLGLGAIFIDCQDENKKNFFTRIREYSGEEFRGEYWGVPVRADSETNWIGVDEIYNRTKKGPHNIRELSASISSKLEMISSQIMELGENLSGSKKVSLDVQEQEDRIADILNDVD